MIDFRINGGGVPVQITNNETRYKLEEITGLNGFERNNNLMELAGQDGSIFNSDKLPSREIVATIGLVGNIEQNRMNLVSALRISHDIFLFFKTDSRDTYIEARVKTMDANAFSNIEAAQIAFTCPNPFFHSYHNTETSISRGSSRTSVINAGDVPIGFQAVISLSGMSNSPTYVAVEKNDDSGDHKIIINYPDGFQNGDVITIKNSYQNNEKVVTLSRNNQTINLISSIDRVNTEWFSLGVDSNNIRFKVGDTYSYTGTYTCTITLRPDYLAL